MSVGKFVYRKLSRVAYAADFSRYFSFMANRKPSSRKAARPDLEPHPLLLTFQRRVVEVAGKDPNWAELADKMGASRSMLNRFVNKKSINISLNYALYLAKALEVPFERLIAESAAGSVVRAEDAGGQALAKQIVDEMERRNLVAKLASNEPGGPDNDRAQGGPASHLGD